MSFRARLGQRRFGLVLALAALVAFGARLAYGRYAHHSTGLGDDWWYHWMANTLADGRGFNNPLETLAGGRAVPGFAGTAIPTAYHPPLFPVVLGVGSKLGFTSYGAHRAIGCALGAATTVVIGLTGRRLVGERLGMAAALLAAVYPPLVADDSVLLSESLYCLMIALVILAALRLLEAPTGRRAALLGGAIGLAALTRSEAVLLLVLLVPLVVRRQARLALAAAGVAAVMVVPWCVRNTAEFGRFVTVATGDGSVLAGANTPATYHGALLGAWDPNGLKVPVAGLARTNEAVASERLRRRALTYAGDHAGRLPAVLAARVLRTWSLYPQPPAEQVRYDAFLAGRERWAEWLSLIGSWLASALAIVGAVALRRRGAPLAPLLAPVVLVTLVSLLFNGDPRYRAGAEPSLVLLATAGAAWALGRLRSGRAGSPR